MSKDVELFARPKVRFSQTSDNEEEMDNIKPSSHRTVGPKIRSIVSLNKPVKILSLDEAPSSLRNKELCSIVQKTECSNALPSLTKQLTSLCINAAKTDNQKPLSDASNTQNIKANSEELDVPKHSNKRLNDNAENATSSCPTAQDEIIDKILKSQSNFKSNSKGCEKNKRGKENERSVTKRTIKSTGKKDGSGCLKITAHQKTKPCAVGTNPKRPNVVVKSSTVSSIRNLNSKSAAPNVMPCHKYKAASKVKTSPVKKTVIRDIVGHKVKKPYVGPGLSRKKQGNSNVPETKENGYIRPEISGEKLARPEYNSIMCTINKLKEVEKQKIVADVEHLPAVYKNLVNGKISAGLNFALEEAVYKNLVDLSIDEKQLPSRIMRSKDPEPRQRDIVPVLSDFFTPECTEEYCAAVSVKSRTPESTESWNAYRISDKIFEWKYNMDHS